MTDHIVEEVREARRRIEEACGNDPAKLIEHYMEYQKQFSDRLVDLHATRIDEARSPLVSPGVKE